MTPISIRRQLVLERSREMLRTTGMSIGEIAEALGFDSVFGFTHFFTARTGISPSKFRSLLNYKWRRVLKLDAHLYALLRMLYYIMVISLVTVFEWHHGGNNVFTGELPFAKQFPCLSANPVKIPPEIIPVGLAARPGEEYVL